MKNNKISKITTLASLLVAGIVNAQEFYTCVPKKDWWKNTIKESVKEQKKEEWRLIKSVDVNKRDGQDQNVLLKIPVGNVKIKLVRGSEVIGEYIKNGTEGHITYYDIDCDCGKTDKCTSYESDFDIDNMILVNNYFPKQKFNMLKNNKCEHIGSPINSFVITLNNKSLLFGAMLWKNYSMFDMYFKGTTLKVYEKVED